ncbi:hypothetical protein EJB05_31905, partial [Eragrostis curvula]
MPRTPLVLFRGVHNITPERLKQIGTHFLALAASTLSPSSPLPSMEFPKFLLLGLLLSLLASASYSATSWDDEDFFKTCSSHRCSKHGPQIRFPFRLSSNPPSCGAPGMLLSCSGHDTILDHPVLGACKVTEIYYRFGIINAIPLADSSSQCPLQKLVPLNQSTDVYKPMALEDSVLLGCQTDFIAANQEEVVGPSSCLSFSNNASQFWYLVNPETDMSTLPMGCVVVASDIPIPYSCDKNGRRYHTPFFGRSLFKEKAYKTIHFGETSLNWSINIITSVCQRCEQDGKHCGFSSNRGQAFCQRHGSNVILIAATTSAATLVVLVATALYLSLKRRYSEEIHMKVEIETTEEEKEKVKQMAIVALWCIQWNPKNRPSMSKVVNMLTGRLQNLQIPPKPFVSSKSHSMV